MRYYWRFIQYLWDSKHRKGFGVHSPFVFYMVTKVIEEKLPYYAFPPLSYLRDAMEKGKREVSMRGNNVKISSLAKNELPNSLLRVLFRLVQFMKPVTIVELGVSTGLSTSYMALSRQSARVYAVEENDQLAAWSKVCFEKLKLTNVEVRVGDLLRQTKRLSEELDQVDFLYIGRHCPDESLLSAFDELKGRLGSHSMVVMADIHRTTDRENVWSELKKTEGVKVVLEMFFFGILIKDEEIQQGEYNLFYIPPLFTK